MNNPVFNPNRASKGALTKDRFLKDFNRDFKKGITPAKITGEDKVVVAYSGGHSSAALLNFMDECVFPAPKEGEKRRYRFSFDVSVLHVDLSDLFYDEPEEKPFDVEKDMISFLRERYKKIKNIHAIKFKNEYVKFIESHHEISAKEDILRSLVKRQILEFAKEKGYNIVLSGASATRVCFKTVSEICKGNGHRVCEFVKLRSREKDGIVWIQPMLKVMQKEVIFYNHFKKVRTFFMRDFGTLRYPKTSTIDKLVENYLTQLHKDNDGTIFTILRTAGRLKLDDEDFKKRGVCRICLKVLEESAKDLTCYGCRRNMTYNTKKYVPDEFIIKDEEEEEDEGEEEEEDEGEK